MKTKSNVLKKLVLFAAAFAFCAVLCAKPMDVKAALTAPTGVKQTGAETTAVAVQWTAVAGATQYGVQCSTNANFTDGSETKVSAIGKNIYSLSAGKTYYVRVRAYSSSSVYSAWSATLKVDTCPNNVTSIKQTSAKETSVTYTWSKVDGATGYIVLKALPTDSSWTTVTKTANTSYTLAVPKNSVYDVAVVPYRNAANSANIAACPYDPRYTSCVPLPTAPKKLAVTGGDSDGKKLEFAWNPSSIAENTDGYQIEVYKYTKKGKKKSRIAKVTMTRSSYESYVRYDGGYPVKKSAMHTNAICFRVRAYATINGAKKYGKWSSYKDFVPQAVHKKLKANSRTNATLTWKKVAGATSYDVYYKTSSSPSASWKRVAKGVKGTSASVPLNYYGRSYYYVKTNKVFGKKKFTSLAPKKAAYVTYWSRY